MIVGLGKISQAAVFVEDQNPFGNVCLVVDACIADEVRCFFLAQVKMRGSCLDPLLNLVFCEGLWAELNSEQASVEQPLAQQGQHAVLMVSPRLHGDEDVTVVKFAETLQNFRVCQKFCAVQVVVQEQRQGRGGKHRGPLTNEMLGAVQDEHQHVLCTQYGSVQIHLPIHEPPRHDELFDRINGLLFDAKLTVHDVQHFDDAFTSDFAFSHATVKAVAREVVQSVHVQLTADQLVEEWLGVMVVENFDCQVQGAPHLVVQTAHDECTYVFVVNALDDAVFQSMAEGAMTHVVQQDGQTSGFRLFLSDGDTFVAQAVDGFLHQVHAPDGVVETVVDGARIDQVRKSQL